MVGIRNLLMTVMKFYHVQKGIRGHSAGGITIAENEPLWALWSYINININIKKEKIYIYTNYTILAFSISIVYPSNKTRMNFIQYAK